MQQAVNKVYTKFGIIVVWKIPNDRKNKTMKKLMILIAGLILTNHTIWGRGVSSADSLRILSSPDLFKLSSTWANEYAKTHPDAGIKVITIPETGMTVDLLNEGNISFVTGNFLSADETFWKMIVGRDVIVPVINSLNPFMIEISQKGISPENLALFLNDEKNRNWNVVTGKDSYVDLYFINDGSIINGITEFAKAGTAEIEGTKVENTVELINAIRKDLYSIGFCKLIDIIDAENQSLMEGAVYHIKIT